MKISITCTGCGRTLRADAAHAGKTSRCPQCGETITVPHPEPVEHPDIELVTDEPEPEAPAQETAAEARASEDRVPCPACAELIMRDAAKCRFCGHVLDAERAGEKKRLNVPAVASLALGLLAWPVVGACFFLWFKQILPSLRMGAIVSGAAVACGVAGAVVHQRRKCESLGGMMLSITGAIMGVFGLSCFLLYAVLAKKASDAMPASMPAAGSVKQILGTEKVQKVPVQCVACAHQFEVAPSDILAKQAEDAAKLFSGVGGDINKLLDDVGSRGPLGMVCPKCKKPKAFPMQECPKCKHRYLPDIYKKPGEGGLKMACPKCGASSPLISGDLLKSLGALGRE